MSRRAKETRKKKTSAGYEEGASSAQRRLQDQKNMPPPSANSHKITGRLEIEQEPEQTFFKDEGGKSHCLVVVVRLVNVKMTSTTDKITKKSTFDKWIKTALAVGRSGEAGPIGTG